MTYKEKINDIVKRFKKLNHANILYLSVNELKVSIEAQAIAENQAELHEEGIDVNGLQLRTNRSYTNSKEGFYAIYTEKEKAKTDKPFDRVTLNQTGDFYRTFFLKVTKEYMQINANFKKDSSNIYDNFTIKYSDKNSFETSVLYFTDSFIEQFPELIEQPFYKNIKQKLGL